MRVVRSPSPPEDVDHPALFLFMAGGITGTPRWQLDLLKLLRDGPNMLVVLDPRRDNFDTSDASLFHEQIEWEFSAIEMAHGMSFWFPAESVCSIALFELGQATMCEDNLFVGCDPAYPRRADVVKQLSLCRRDGFEVQVRDNLGDLAQDILKWSDQ